MVDYAAWFDVDDLSVEQVAHLWAEGRADIAAMRLQILQSAIAAGKLRVDGKTSLIWRGDLKEFAEARGERPVFLFGHSPVAKRYGAAPNPAVVGNLQKLIAAGSPLFQEAERHTKAKMARLTEAIERAAAREAKRRAEYEAAAQGAGRQARVRSGNRSYGDEAIVAKVVAAVENGGHKSFRAAATAIVDEIRGAGTEDARIKRIADKASRAWKGKYGG